MSDPMTIEIFLQHFLPSILPGLLPIVLGAIIGYVTNAIAIRMLFRPLKAYRILGIRVPFTPGIIPRQREALAESIGTMVSDKLLNREAVQNHLKNPEFEKKLATSLQSLTHNQGFARDIGDFLRNMISQRDLDQLTQNLGTSIISLQLGDMISPKLVQKVIPYLINNSLLEHIAPATIERMSDFAKSYTQENHTLESLLTQDVRDAIRRVTESLYRPTVEFVVEWLKRPEVRSELTKRGKRILGDILKQFSSVQRFLLSAGQYDRTLEEKMPSIITDLIQVLEESLENPENKLKILTALDELLERLARTPLKELEQRVNGDLADLTRKAGYALLDILHHERLGLRLVIVLRRYLEEYRSKTLEDAIVLVSNRKPQELFGEISFGMQTWIHTEGNLESFLTQVFKVLSGGTNTLAPQVLRGVLEETVPGFIERLDVRTLVVNRINSLEVRQVEDLLLAVMQKHLKWINVFGALLGATIGALQLFL
jgi:uncharacterized membrane protein YheB (UPF0754 family)